MHLLLPHCTLQRLPEWLSDRAYKLWRKHAEGGINVYDGPCPLGEPGQYGCSYTYDYSNDPYEDKPGGEYLREDIDIPDEVMKAFAWTKYADVILRINRKKAREDLITHLSAELQRTGQDALWKVCWVWVGLGVEGVWVCLCVFVVWQSSSIRAVICTRLVEI